MRKLLFNKYQVSKERSEASLTGNYNFSIGRRLFVGGGYTESIKTGMIESGNYKGHPNHLHCSLRRSNRNVRNFKLRKTADVSR
jgi:hypothetical protein